MMAQAGASSDDAMLLEASVGSTCTTDSTEHGGRSSHSSQWAMDPLPATACDRSGFAIQASVGVKLLLSCSDQQKVAAQSEHGGNNLPSTAWAWTATASKAPWSVAAWSRCASAFSMPQSWTQTKDSVMP